MFESLVIVTREGVEAALVVAIVLAYLKRTGNDRLVPWVFAGLSAAVACSILGVLLIPNLAIHSERIEGWALLAGALCVSSLVVWMRHAGKSVKREIEGGLTRLSGSGNGRAGPSPATRAGWGVLLFVGFMVLREGLETVLFLTAISFNTDGLARLVGGLLGLGVAAVFGVLFVRGTVRVHLARFFSVTSVILTVLAIQLLVGAYHEFAEAGLVPASRVSMAIVGPIVRYDSLVFAAALLITLLLVGRSSGSARPASGSEDENPAERRKRLSRERRERITGQAAVITAATAILILATGFLTQARVPARAEATPADASKGEARVSVQGLADGHAHYFQAQAGGKTVRFFVIQAPRRGLVACFDACEICGDKGYYEEGGGMTCRNCTAPINLATLGQTGGCNPIPLASRVEGDSLVVSEPALAGGASHFDAAP